MDKEEALKILESLETDLNCPDSAYKGIQYLHKFCEEIEFASEHNQIWLNDFEETVKKMEKEDVIYLGKMGFLEDEDAWSFFT